MYGIIDIGSNTVRLALYEVKDGRIHPMLNKKYTAGLAGYIKNGSLTREGIDTAIEILTEFRHILEYIHVRELYCLATASLRNINNTDEVVAEIKETCGFDVIIISGEQEAAYDYYGAIQSVSEDHGLIIDIGGGSTEIAYYKNNTLLASASIPIGSLTAYTSYVKGLLPTAAERKKITAAVESMLSSVTLPKDAETDIICGVGGTIRSSAKLESALYGTRRTCQLTTQTVRRMIAVSGKNNNVLIHAILKTAPERIHTIIPGLTILTAVSAHWNAKTIVISRSGVKEGYLYSVLQQRGEL